MLQPGLGNIIREARLRAEQTLEQFGEALGVTRGAVSNWEQGRALPRPRLLDRIADLTGHSPDELAHMFFPVRVIHVVAYRWQCSICDRKGPVLTGDTAKTDAEAEGIRHSRGHEDRLQPWLQGETSAGDPG